jgi:hypothetical protein
VPETRIGGVFGQCSVQLRSREPPYAAFVGHDVGDRLAVHCQGHALAGPDSIDHLACPIAQISHAYVHVRQCSTTEYRPSDLGGVLGGVLLRDVEFWCAEHHVVCATYGLSIDKCAYAAAAALCALLAAERDLRGAQRMFARDPAVADFRWLAVGANAP